MRFPPAQFGHTEILIALVLLFILFGHHLPGIMRDLGRSFIRGPWN